MVEAVATAFLGAAFVAIGFIAFVWILIGVNWLLDNFDTTIGQIIIVWSFVVITLIATLIMVCLVFYETGLEILKWIGSLN